MFHLIRFARSLYASLHQHTSSLLSARGVTTLKKPTAAFSKNNNPDGRTRRTEESRDRRHRETDISRREWCFEPSMRSGTTRRRPCGDAMAQEDTPRPQQTCNPKILQEDREQQYSMRRANPTLHTPTWVHQSLCGLLFPFETRLAQARAARLHSSSRTWGTSVTEVCVQT